MGETPTGSGGGTDAGASSGPSTFAEAFAADASPASDPSSQTSSTQPAAAQPGSAEATPTPDDRSPFIPRSRFDEVNGRLKAAETWKQQYGWVEQIPQGDLQQAINLARQVSADPVAYVQQLISELQAHPTHGAALRSAAARALAAGRGQSANTMPEPDVAITDEHGQVVGQTYSAQQLAKRDEWLTQQVLAKVDERYASTRETAESIKKQEHAAQVKAEADQWSGGFNAELNDLYGAQAIKANKVAIGQEVVRIVNAYEAAHPQAAQNPGEYRSFLESATLRAAQKIIGASTRSQAESTVLDNLKQRAAASTSVSPNAATASTPKRIDSFHQLPADAWR